MDFATDYVLNGRAVGGDVASTLLQHKMDYNVLRPYNRPQPNGEPGYNYIDIVRNGADGKPKRQSIVTNAPAALRFQDWRLIDEAIVKVSIPRMNALGMIQGAGLSVNVPGMGVTVFSYEDQSNISAATISMSPSRQSEEDRPVYNIYNLPLPIIHKDFSFDIRELEASRRGNSPLDLSTAELAGTRVAEAAEDLLLGTLPTYAYGGGSVYGLTNWTSRLTKVLTSPAAGGWTPAVTVTEVLAMIAQAQAVYQFGPYFLWYSPNWQPYMNGDYSSAKGDNTLLQRLSAIKGLSVEQVDRLAMVTGNPYTMLLIQKSGSTIRIVSGMEITTMQWNSLDGFRVHFKVMAMKTPQLRTDQNGNSGVVHGSIAS